MSFRVTWAAFLLLALTDCWGGVPMTPVHLAGDSLVRPNGGR